MCRRWIIRAFFLLPILLCVAGWVRSAWPGGILSYRTQDCRCVTCEGQWGIIAVGAGTDGTPPEGLHWRSLRWVPPGPPARLWPPCTLSSLWPPTFPSVLASLGFGSASVAYQGTYTDMHLWFFPCWLPIVILSIALWIAWRKTRPTINPAAAFPVEVVARK